MELQKTETENKKDWEQNYKEKSFTYFVISAVFFVVFIFCLYVSRVEDLAATFFGIATFILGFVMLGIAVSFLFKYKFQKNIIAYKNISTVMAGGIVLVLLILSWRLIILTSSQNLAKGLKMSVIEWIIFAVGILLIVRGIFKKSK